jgi:uncharacterized protein YdeI (YjbR/CyaY-like superfamily)
MIAAGKMTARGLAVFKPDQKTESYPTSLPADLEKRFRADSKAWKNFEACPPYYRRMSVAWVASAKKEATQQTRLQTIMVFSGRGERIKWM